MFSLQTGVVPGRFSATQRFSKIRSSPEKSNSEVGTLLKSQIRPAWAAEWEMGDSPTLGDWWVDSHSGSPALCCFNPVDISFLLSSAGLWVCDLSFQETQRPRRESGIAVGGLGWECATELESFVCR